jgi:type I restriction enzyme, S subunit
MTSLTGGWESAPLGGLVDNLDSLRVPVSAKLRAKRIGAVPYYGAAGQVGVIDGALFDEDLVLLGEDGVQFFDAAKPKAYRISGPSWVNNHAHVLRPHRDVIDHGFLMHYLNHCDYRGFANGTTRLKLTQAAMNRLLVPLPPIEQQRLIVDVLEDHLSCLDAAQRYLTHSEQLGRALRFAILERLARIPGDVVLLGELASESGYGTSAKCSVGGPGAPVVRIPNLVNGQIDMRNEKRVADEGTDVSRLMLRAGDLLIVRTNGSRDLIGRCAVVQVGVEAAFASYLIRFRLDGSRVDPAWVRAIMETPAMRRNLESHAASSAGQYNLGLKKLATLPIPVPSLLSQRTALAWANEQLGSLGRLKQGAQVAATRASTLRRALMASAFSGRLTGKARSADDLEEFADV